MCSTRRMRIHGHSALLGLDQRFVFPLGILDSLERYSLLVPDADNFNSSSIFDPNPRSGFGGWGDPQNDFQITTGAFASDFELLYPAPHRLRRNFSLSPPPGPGLGDEPPITQPLNTFITPESIRDMVDGFPGDFVGFQKLFEGGNGSHGAVHIMVGGCVAITAFVPFYRSR